MSITKQMTEMQRRLERLRPHWDELAVLFAPHRKARHVISQFYSILKAENISVKTMAALIRAMDILEGVE